MSSKFLVCARLTTYVRAHSLEGILVWTLDVTHTARIEDDFVSAFLFAFGVKEELVFGSFKRPGLHTDPEFVQAVQFCSISSIVICFE